jgi:hypothetical protein
MTKPTLYHGSPAQIETFRPRDGKDAGRVPYYGTMATDSREMAMVYALKLKEGFDPTTGEGAFGGQKDGQGNDAQDFMLSNNLLNGTFVAIFRNRDSYLKTLEKAGSGYLYTLPNETFEPLQKPAATPTTEWLSTSTEIKPQSAERITLEGAMRSGAQILFLSDKYEVQDLKIATKDNWDEGEKQLELYKRLIKEGMLINENAQRGIPNPLNLPEGQDFVQGTGQFTGNPRNQPGQQGGRSLL